MLTMSFLNPRHIRRLSLIVCILSLIMVAATPYFGSEIKGAGGWLVFFGVNIQPSELVSLACCLILPCLIRESSNLRTSPQNTFSLVLLLVVIALLVAQPDFGQTMLIALVWSALFFMAGMRLVWVAGIAGLAAVGLLSAYYTVSHVARRIQRFLDPGSGDTFN